MAQLKDEQFRLDGYLIGPDQDVAVTRLEIGESDPRVQDEDNPTGDNRFFGRDYLIAGVWDLSFLINTYSGEETGPALGHIRKVWDARKARETPGKLQTLHYGAGGRSRHVYGRSRSFSVDPNGYKHGGIEANGKFVLADPYFYDDEAREVTITTVATSAGGIIFPTTFPITTLGSGTRDGAIEDVGGEAPTPYTITINGPIQNPVVKVGGFTLKIATSLAYDRSLVVDTRALTVTRDDGASLAGQLSRKTYLGEGRLRPGSTELKFSGTDPTGTATCKIKWYPANYGF